MKQNQHNGKWRSKQTAQCKMCHYFQMGSVLFENKSVSHRHYCVKTTLNYTTNKPSVSMVMCYGSVDDVEARLSILPYSKY